MRSIKEFCEEAHETAKSKGFWDKPETQAGMIALAHSELSEALEAIRNNEGNARIGEEIGDCFIRLFDFCKAYDIDLEKAIIDKMEKNKNRKYKHGKKF